MEPNVVEYEHVVVENDLILAARASRAPPLAAAAAAARGSAEAGVEETNVVLKDEHVVETVFTDGHDYL